MIDYFFGCDHLARIKYKLDIGENVGHTGYLDFISCSELTYPLMFGRDSWDRSFISIRYTVEYKKCKKCQYIYGSCEFLHKYQNDDDVDKKHHKKHSSFSDQQDELEADDCPYTKEKHTVVSTLFQRYPHSKILVCIGTRDIEMGLKLTLKNCFSVVQELDVIKQRIGKLMHGEMIKSFVDVDSISHNNVVGNGNVMMYIESYRQQCFELLCTWFYKDIAEYILSFY